MAQNKVIVLESIGGQKQIRRSGFTEIELYHSVYL